jgi:hydrogenase maturation factor/beta-phosphoglucomutase-like phosphatase (HAD superfamily)
MTPSAYRIDAVLFDFDGTLTRPGVLDWSDLKGRIDCPLDRPVLEFIEGLSDEQRKADALRRLEVFERRGAALSRPAEGAEKLVHFLIHHKIPVGIVSRNQGSSIDIALANFTSLTRADFDVIVSREHSFRPKPSPDGVLHAARQLGVPAAHVLVVGDYVMDIDAGRRAGTLTAYLDHAKNGPQDGIECDFRIHRLVELETIVRFGRPLPGGKIPNDLLETILSDLDIRDPSILIRPGVGQDTTAVDVCHDEIVVLKSDPITFVTDSIGEYAVFINANDVATAGADGRWLLTTLLFPVRTTPAQIRQVIADIDRVCRRSGITLCGGHTEVTDAVNRPVVSGMLVGTVAKERLIDKRRVTAGDVVVLTKAVAVEGTAILAREFGRRLQDLGMADADIQRAAGFLSNISVLEEARIAAAHAGVSAMHDVTEGGLATAIAELSAAGNHRIRVFMDRIAVYPETSTMCRLLDIEPLGLIGSGSLLICCSADSAEDLIAAVRSRGIAAAAVGEVMESGRGIEAMQRGRPVPWPTFDADELTRLYT